MINIAAADAPEGLDVEYVLADLRDLDFEDEFDIVLNLQSGAIGYFENDEQNHRGFETIARALRSGGRSLMQIPNVLYAEARLPERSWTIGSEMIELVERHWNPRDRYMEGVMIAVDRAGSLNEPTIGFRQRLYTVEELRDIFRSVGMSLVGTFDADGVAREPTAPQFEFFAVARRD